MTGAPALANIGIMGIGIMGAGLMGAGLAQAFASAGVPVSIWDPDPAARESLLARVAANSRIAGDAEPEAVVSRVTVCGTLGPAWAGLELIIEAGPENLTTKRQIVKTVETAGSPAAIIASNTSSLPIGAIASEADRPDRVIGTHFWHPPALVPLVEVIPASTTSDTTTGLTARLLAGVGFDVALVRADIPGFIGNRLQHALKREAIALVASGVCSAETVDMVVRKGFGRRLGIVGPLEQADLGGLDLTLAIHEVVMPDIDATRSPHPHLRAMVERGDLGAKTGRGFYTWEPGQAERRRAEIMAALVSESGSA
jgi:3-hydroxybutyryl-CoA dehydrogenase